MPLRPHDIDDSFAPMIPTMEQVDAAMESLRKLSDSASFDDVRKSYFEVLSIFPIISN